jgi:hypothetical protein
MIAVPGDAGRWLDSEGFYWFPISNFGQSWKSGVDRSYGTARFRAIMTLLGTSATGWALLHS